MTGSFDMQGGQQYWNVLECTGMYWSEKCTGKCTGIVPSLVLEKLCTGKFEKNLLKVLEYTGIRKIVYWSVLRNICKSLFVISLLVFLFSYSVLTQLLVTILVLSLVQSS